MVPNQQSKLYIIIQVVPILDPGIVGYLKTESASIMRKIIVKMETQGQEWTMLWGHNTIIQKKIAVSVARIKVKVR